VSAGAYGAVLIANLERVPGVDGLLMKEKLGGKSVLSHSLDRFDEDERCEAIIVLAAPAVRDWISNDPLTFASTKLRVLPAADGRAKALELLSTDSVVVHNGARPNWQPTLLDSLLKAWQPGGAAIPAGSPSGLVVRAAEGGAAVLGQPEELRVLETPEVFDRARLLELLQGTAADTHSRDVWLAAGLPLALVPARPHNFAIRDGDSLHLMRRLLGEPKRASKDKYGGLGW
jgi:2-C-methyl-D-erythritol 4-phosphate cytidylyltransferase